MKKFSIDKDMLDIFDELEYDEIGMIVMAIGDYCYDGTFKTDDMTDRATRIAANVIKKQIDKAEAKSLICAEAGRKAMQRRYGG